MLIIASSLQDHAVTPNCTGGENVSAEIPATKPAVFSHFCAKLTRGGAGIVSHTSDFSRDDTSLLHPQQTLLCASWPSETCSRLPFTCYAATTRAFLTKASLN
jgi:hypothetical protein